MPSLWLFCATGFSSALYFSPIPSPFILFIIRV